MDQEGALIQQALEVSRVIERLPATKLSPFVQQLQTLSTDYTRLAATIADHANTPESSERSSSIPSSGNSNEVRVALKTSLTWIRGLIRVIPFR